MVPYFQRRLPRDGHYLGIDVHTGCLQWCQEHFASDNRLSFMAPPLPSADSLSQRYDLVLAKSLFTHLVPSEAVHYLNSMAARLSDNGRVILTAFLFDELSSVPALPHSRMNGRVRHRSLFRPRAAVGFDRLLFAEWVANAGLEVHQSHLWFWPGHHAALSAQDILVCRKRGSQALVPSATASASPTAIA